MIADFQAKHLRAVPLRAQLLTCTDPLPSGTPLHCLCDTLPTGLVHRHQVNAAGLALLCVLGLCVRCVHRHRGAGHVVSFQGVLG